MDAGVALLTFGHGVATVDQLATLIQEADIREVVDVRTVPKSRRLPHVWREQLERWVPELARSAYHWAPALGGFRKPRRDSPNVALRNDAFRGYADYMETPEFKAALATLMQQAAHERTAIMCSESLWWRCHRRLISDAAVLLCGAEVRHLMHDGSLVEHVLTDGVRKTSDGTLRYDLVAGVSQEWLNLR
ncbi:MAG: DUF488 domain-containing protein [Candidatus Eremiobacteraeota bacterium]|nr:DUF488 domain-containing protein [Candidatus Eremiobacteraeota bacterium]